MTDATPQLPQELREQFEAMAQNPGDLADITGIYAWLYQHPNLQARLLKLQEHLGDRNYQKAFAIALDTMNHLDPAKESELLNFIFVCIFLHKTLNDEAIKKYFATIPQFDYYSKLWQTIHMLYHYLTGIKFFQKDQVLKHAVTLRKLIGGIFPKSPVTQQQSEAKKTTVTKITPTPKSAVTQQQPKTEPTPIAATTSDDKFDILYHQYGESADNRMSLLSWVLQTAIDYSRQVPASNDAQKEFASLIEQLEKMGIPKDEIKITAAWVVENWDAVREGMLSESENKEVRQWVLHENEKLNPDKIREFIQQAAAIDTPAVNYRH